MAVRRLGKKFWKWPCDSPLFHSLAYISLSQGCCCWLDNFVNKPLHYPSVAKGKITLKNCCFCFHGSSLFPYRPNTESFSVLLYSSTKSSPYLFCQLLLHIFNVLPAIHSSLRAQSLAFAHTDEYMSNVSSHPFFHGQLSITFQGPEQRSFPFQQAELLKWMRQSVRSRRSASRVWGDTWNTH